MKIKTRLAALALFSAFALPTHAACDGCVVGAVKAASTAIVGAVSAASTAIVGAVTTNTTFLINAMRGATTTITSQQARSAEMVAEANQRTQAQIETTRQQARFVPPDGCGVVAASRGMQDASRGSIALGGGVGRSAGGGARSATGGVTANMQKALDIAANRVEAPPPEQQAALAADGACRTFVSTAGNPVRAKSCTTAGFTPSVSNGHPDADIRAETLFDGPQTGTTAAQFKRKLTVDADGAQRQAVEAYMRNLSTPIDLPQLSKAELARPAGRQYLAMRDTYEARMALAMKPAAALAQNRTANPALVPVLQQLLVSDVSGNFVQNYLAKAYPNWNSRGVSVDELINLEAERRYLNKDWHVKMASLPPEAHVKEQTAMMSYQVMLLARLYEKLDTLGVVSGQGAATQIRQEMVPQLITMHGQALR